MGGTWRNWSGRVECRPSKYAEPKSLEELQVVVRDAAASGKKVRVVGSGHSFTELVATDDVLITLDGLQGLVEAKPEAGEATVWAGTKLHLLNPMLDERGLAMENLGDINVQSIAGAVSTGTHGTGIKFGNIATQVIGLTLVTASGDLLEVSETQNRDLFKAAQVSLGTMGVIAKVRLRLVPSYKLDYWRKKSTFTETLAKAEEWRDAHRQFEFYCFPHAPEVQLKFLDNTDEPVNVNARKKWFADVFMENLMFGAMSMVCRAFPSTCVSIARFCAGTVGYSHEINIGHKSLSTIRMVKFNEMEFALPQERGLGCVKELKEWIDRERVTVHFPIEFRYVKGDDICISPHTGRDSAAISVHQFKGMDYKKYFDGCEAIFRNYNARPHWGKLHSKTAKDLRVLYPKWDEFQRARQQLDPKGVFLTPYLKSLFVE